MSQEECYHTLNVIRAIEVCDGYYTLVHLVGMSSKTDVETTLL